MVYHVGIRNNACSLVLALTYFPPCVAIPITLSILYQQPLATLIPYIYKRFAKTAYGGHQLIRLSWEHTLLFIAIVTDNGDFVLMLWPNSIF